MKQLILFIGCALAGLWMNIAMGFSGYHQLSVDQVLLLSTVLEATIAISIAPEGYAYGLHSSRHHWISRWSKLLLWLTVGLITRALMLYVVGYYFALEHAGEMAAGMLATDPAGVSITLAFAEPVHLQAMFWQMAVESQLNDAAGIAAYGLVVGHGWGVLVTLIETIGAGLALAFVQTLARRLLRHNGSTRLELPVVLVCYGVFIAWGISREWSLILLSATASIVADFWEHRIHLEEELKEKILHQWEWINSLGLAIILGLVAFIMPWTSFANRQVVTIAVALVLTVALNRGMMEFGYRVLHHRHTGQPGHEYGYKAALVNWLGGVSLLGVPSIIALRIFESGDALTADSMLIAVALSLVVIPPTVLLINWVERTTGGEIEPEFAELPFGPHFRSHAVICAAPFTSTITRILLFMFYNRDQ